MSEAYKKAIDILAAGSFDANKIAVELAKVNPELFVQIASGKSTAEEMLAFAIERHKANGDMFIQTIKDLRTQYGLGLKEAKDIADEAKEKLRRR